VGFGFEHEQILRRRAARSGFSARPPGIGPGMTEERDPHHPLNQPAEDPDPTEWPDPYDKRKDPREHRPHPGDQSTSEPPPSQDPEAEPHEGPKRDKLDE
jgi:hypothetical protein